MRPWAARCINACNNGWYICAVQRGAGVQGELAERELAAGGSASASSSQLQHPASSAIGGDAASFWASAQDPSETTPVDLTIGLAAASHISSVEIDWELPAKSFEVQASTGGAYRVLYSTYFFRCIATLLALINVHAPQADEQHEQNCGRRGRC